MIRAWGFKYRSCLVCRCPTLNTGPYWCESHYLLLLGTRGRLPFADKKQPSWMECDWPEGSGKPEAIRELIQMVSPGPYLELFGTVSVHGWTVCGDEQDPE